MYEKRVTMGGYAVAMRGRWCDKRWKQHIEIRRDGIANCLTRVAKDSMVIRKVECMKKESKGFCYVEDEDGYATSAKGDIKASVATVAKIPKDEFDEDEGRWDSNEEESDITEEEISEEKTVYDYLIEAQDGDLYGIFKLSPRECGRLMGVRDSDIDKMLAVNSNSQCYKQYGNSIIVPVLCAIFSQLNIAGIKPWNKRTMDEIRPLLGVVGK